MKRPQITTEWAFYSLIFILAVAIRLVDLARVPLSDTEAALALQAADMASGRQVAIASQPGLVAWMAALFAFFGSSTFVARLLPAVAGSLLVFAPALFRRQLGRPAALLLAFGLAVDPGLAATARQVDGRMIAITFTVFAAGYLLKGSAAGAGIFAGLAILGGPSVWPGLAALVMTAGIRRAFPGATDDNGENNQLEGHPGFEWRKALLYLGAAILVGGTVFLAYPGALSAVPGSLAAYIQGWGQGDLISPGLLLAALLFYEILPLVIGLRAGLGALRGRNKTDGFLVLWLAVSLVLALLYPSRQVADLAWSLIPLWALAARWLAGLQWSSYRKAGVIIQGLLSATLLLFSWMNLLYLPYISGISEQQTARWVSVMGGLMLLLLVATFFAWIGGWKSSLRGLSASILLLLLLYTFSTTWRAANFSSILNRELWTTGNPPEPEVLVKTADEYSNWKKGRSGSLDLVVVGIQSPAMRWALRDYTQLTFSTSLPAEISPSIVITPVQAGLGLAATYTGQDFAWMEAPRFSQLSPMEWFKWAVFRDIPVDPANVVFWLRSDLFPGAGSANPTP